MITRFRLMVVIALLASSGVARGAITFVGTTFTNANGKQVTSLDLTEPPGTVAGDLMLTIVSVQDNGEFNTITPPAGWTLLREDSAGTGCPSACSDGLHQAIYWRIATDATTTTYTWNFSLKERTDAGIVVYRGVDPSNPFEATSGVGTFGTGTVTAPSVTTASTGSRLIGFFSVQYGNAGFDISGTGMTVLTDAGGNPYNPLSTGGSTAGVTQAVADQTLAAAGATGDRVATVVGGKAAWGIGQLVLLKGLGLDHFEIEAVGGGLIAQQNAGQSFNIRIRAVDASGTTVPFSGKVDLGSNCTIAAGGGTTPSFTNGVLDNYSVNISEANTCRFTATETGGTTTGTSNDFDVVAGPLTALQIVVPAATVAGTLFTVTVNAVDAYGNVITATNDEIALTSDDPNAPMPPNQLLVNGTASFNVTLSSAPRTTTIVASDVTDASVAPASGVTNVSAVTNGFNAFDTATPAGDTIGWIKTKIAGAPISLDIVALANGNFQGTVTVELIAADDDSTAACPADAVPVGTVDTTGWTGLLTWTVDFKNAVNNRTTMPAFTENNAWRRARILIIDGGQTYCSNDMFAIRPDGLGSVLVQDETRTTAGAINTLDITTVGSTHVHNAGRPFRIEVPALNANGVITSNYDGSPEPELPLQPAIASCTGCVPGTFTTGTWGASGTVITTTATYSEAGAFSTRLVDEHFADVDLSDGSTNAERYIYSGTFSVGRFVPDHFAVTLNTPQFATGCAAGQFTYTGKAFDFAVAPVISVTAQNAANDTTTNYTGSLFRLTDTSLTGRSYADAAAPATAVLDTAGLPATTADPGIVDNGDGTSTLTFSTGTGLDYVHAAPVAPFNSLIDLSINVQDLDGVDVTSIDSAPATNPVVFNDIAFDNGNQMRYGRLFVGSAVGTELMNLPIPMTVQYYASTSDGFVTNAADDCTVLAASDIGLSNFQPYPGSLFATGDTAASINSFANGIFDLELAAPGAGKQGSVDVSAALSALMWLQFDWNGDNTYSEDPSSRAAFGIYSGNPHRVYQHEVVGP